VSISSNVTDRTDPSLEFDERCARTGHQGQAETAIL